MENLKEREIKGLALSTIILLVIKADDHNVTKVKGIKLKIESTHYSIMVVLWYYFGSSIGPFNSNHLLKPPKRWAVFKRPILLAVWVASAERQS